MDKIYLIYWLFIKVSQREASEVKISEEKSSQKNKKLGFL
jgi:hypothetical protein